MTSGPSSGTTFEVTGDVVIGRDDADLTIADDQMSRRHAALRPGSGGIELEDLGSTNGTFLDGRRISEPVTLTQDATLRLGTSEIALKIIPAEPELPPIESTRARAIPDVESTRARAIPDVESTRARAIPEVESTRARAIPDVESTRARAVPISDGTERKLEFIWGPRAGLTVTVDRELVAGRDAELQILDPELSRRHVAIRPVPDGIEVEDLGSTNGTYLNRQRITEPVTVSSAALLHIGRSEIVIELDRLGRTRQRPIVTENNRAVAVFDPRSAVALQESEAEGVEAAVEQEQEQQQQPDAPAAPNPWDALPELPPLPAAAGRLGITESNRRWWVLTACCLGLAMSGLDTTVINVALPTIGRDLNVGLTGLEWMVNAYTLALAVLLVTGGRLGDVYGRRTTFVIGVVIFAVSSAVVGASQSSGMMIASRSVQGIGAAFMTPGTLSIIASVFPVSERGKAIGMWAGVNGIALALGPVVGGLLTEHVTWRAVFYLNIPVAIICLALTALAVPQSRDESAERGLDLAGNVLLSGSLLAVLLALIEGPDWGWGSARVLALFAGALVGLIIFVVLELRIRAPMLDFAALSSPRFIGANLAGFAAFFVMLGMLVYVAVYMQSILNYSALEAGLRFVPGTVLIAIVAPRAGRLIAKVNPRYLIAGGLILCSGAAFVITRITPTSGYGTLLPSMILMGVGIGAMLPPMSATAVMTVRRGKAGLGAGVLSMSRQLGGAFGVAVVGTVFQTLTRSNIEDNLASLPLTAQQRDAIADAGLTAGGGGGAGTGLTEQAGHAVDVAVNKGLVDALASAHYIPVFVALAGVVAVLTMVERQPAGAAEPAPAAAH